MVVEVLVAQSDGSDPLGEQGALVVDEEQRMARVGDGRVAGVEEADAVGDLAEEQPARICGQASTIKVGDDVLGSEGGEVEGLAVTICQSDGLALGGIWSPLIYILQ